MASVVSKELPHVLKVASPVQSAVQQCHTSFESGVVGVPQALMSVPVEPTLVPARGTPVKTRMHFSHSSFFGGGEGQVKVGHESSGNHVPAIAVQSEAVSSPTQLASTQQAAVSWPGTAQLRRMTPSP